MPESFAIILIVLSFSWTTLALDEHVLRYYDSEIIVTNTSINGTINIVVSGAYATIGTPCNMVNCSVKSFMNNCNQFPLDLITSCYLVDCNNEELNSEIIPTRSAVTMDHLCPRGMGRGGTDGLVIPARDIKQMIKRLSIDHKDVFSFPVIVVHYKDASLLPVSAAGVMFSASMRDKRVISYSVTPADHSTHSGSSRSIPKGPFYYATLFLMLVLFSAITLVIVFAIGIGITWMCRKCTVKVCYVASYITCCGSMPSYYCCCFLEQGILSSLPSCHARSPLTPALGAHAFTCET